MECLENDNDKNNSGIVMKITKIVLPLAVLNLIALILVTFGLPDIVPIHINLAGAVDTFGSKWYIPLLAMVPIFIAILYMVYIYTKDSDVNANINFDVNIDVTDKIVSAITLIFIPISWIPVAIALITTALNSSVSQTMVSIEITSFVGILISIIFVFMGYYMEKIEPNKILGIRTPWTLKNETVWKKTHKLASYTSMIAGFVFIIYSLATYLSGNILYFFIGLVIALILTAVVPIIYSYYEYTKL